MIIKLNTGINIKGAISTNRSIIAKKYCSGMLLYDCISLIPLVIGNKYKIFYLYNYSLNKERIIHSLFTLLKIMK